MKAIIDCDPGVDDAVAILYTAAHLDVIGITTVAGNIPVARCTTNALQLVELARIDVPVAQGMERPWIAEPRHAENVHGTSGLAGVKLPEPSRSAVEQHAVEFIIEQARRHPGLLLVTLGPLTNVATALRLAPDLKETLHAIALMGGSTGTGNVTAAAEFNIYTDPEAAHVVFTSGVPLYMAGLNVTEKLTVSDGHIERLERSGKRSARAVADILKGHREQMRREFHLHSPPIHDPCAPVPFIKPDLIRYEPMRVDVERTSPLTRGMTVCDRRAERPVGENPRSNAHVAVDIDAEALMDHILQTVLSYP